MIPSWYSIDILLQEARLPAFPVDDTGFPQPGAVVKHFRRQIKYIDPYNHKEKRWRQSDLAERLGISEVTVRLMETKNERLDSIERRRLLADVLKIPPVLLGLGSLASLEELLQQGNAETQTQSFTRPSGLDTTKKTLYTDALLFHWNMHYSDHTFSNIGNILQWTHYIETDLENKSTPDLELLLCRYYQLLASTYGDNCLFTEAFSYLDNALELATIHGNQQAKAAILYRSGHMRLDQRKFHLARAPLNAALELVNHTDPQLKGAIFQAAGLATALTARSNQESLEAQRFIEQARKFASTTPDSEDEHFLRLDLGRHYLEKSDALLALGKPSAALSALDDADNGTSQMQRRSKAYISILRAEACIRLKNPRLDKATRLLTDAFWVSNTIKSEYNINYIARLYRQLSASSYGKSTEVADLGLHLRNWRKNSL